MTTPQKICAIEEDDARAAVWALHYFEKWQSFPIKEMNDALEKLMSDEHIQNINNLLKGLDKDGKLPIPGDDKVKKLVQKGIQAGVDEATVAALRYVVAREVVKASIGGAVQQGGRRGAVIIIEETASLMAARGGFVAFEALSNPAVGIASVVAEFAASELTSALGVEDKRIVTAAGAAGGILTAVAAGAMVGGPAGAAGGLVVGAGSWLVGQGVSALFRVGHGPADNWCYVVTGDVDGEICVGTYASDDGVYVKTYGNQSLGSNASAVISAGQAQKGSFQLTVWNGTGMFASSIAHFNTVNYRDTIFISRVDGHYVVVHCCGGFSATPAVTKRIVA
ncbi:hypothetical protein PTSG_06615 [Salpingoeca rosetta]|uniref:Uncharacterized protein n=1 Tax=Salpingoeca rosetta (strain ATCC 50818 / BSB-021) TaxID=946362 RepID=F2UFH7_SALR5|nr:uncharacterized protein PTSG_06615 [Salpingoeca rosetta]EGD75545.1 hypothetical protein PTSG_06615 [Salpingoeca rosetta]|eukprot:XP_004992002.1 hypothetical protein PTSG_06615 [Salpingoeca rosetta]